MSGECDFCGEHCLECKCIEQKGTAYHYLGTRDKHIVNLFHWIQILDDLADEVRETDMDNELEKELRVITKRLTNEVGVRMVSLFT